MERKPEDGCEIKTSTFGKCRIMLCYVIIKSPLEDAVLGEGVVVSHGKAVHVRFVSTRTCTTCTWCAESYFSIVPTAKV